jgi:hypothetical protein
MVMKPSSLKSHIDRHEKDKKHERHMESSSSTKVERVEKILIPTTHSVTEKLDKISVLTEKYEKPSHTISSNFGGLFEKTADVKRQRYIMKKPTTVSESSMDTSHYDSLSSDIETKRNRRKRKHEELSEKSSTFQNVTNASSSPQASSSTAACRTIYVDQSELVNVIRDASSPPPLAPITTSSKANDPQTSVVVQITKFMPATVIDGSFVMQPLEQEETEIDLKDLKILKPIVKEPTTSTDNQMLTSSNYYASQPRPLAMNTFNLKKINAQSYVMATQRKLVEFGRNLKAEEKVVGAKITPSKTWSFIERSQVFIPFRITH